MDDGIVNSLIEQLADGVYYVDRKRVILYWNRGAEEITGYVRDRTLGRSCASNLLRHVDEAGNSLCRSNCPLSATMEDGKHRTGLVYLHHADGHRVPVRVSCSPVRDAAGEVIGGVEVFHDASEQQDLLDRLTEAERVALLDPLTGLANRRMIEGLLDEHDQRREAFGVAYGVLFVDIDHFKDVNDTWGHGVGDQVLQMVSRTLLATARGADAVARWGGEEFLVVVGGGDAATLRRVAERHRILIESAWLDLPDGGRLRVTVSIGYAIATGGWREAIERADGHLYAAKEGGRNQVRG